MKHWVIFFLLLKSHLPALQVTKASLQDLKKLSAIFTHFKSRVSPHFASKRNEAKMSEAPKQKVSFACVRFEAKRNFLHAKRNDIQIGNTVYIC